MKKTLAAMLAAGLLAVTLPVVQSWSRTSVTFPHDKHLAADLACDDCHHGIAESKAITQTIDVDLTGCVACHQPEDLAKWGYAAAPEAAKESRVPRFSHSDHLTMGKKCEDCHGALVDSTLAGSGLGMPGHTVCFECHDNVTKTNQCDFCHTGMREGRLDALDRDPGIMKPMSHHPAFIHDHQFQIRLNDKGCADCHQQHDFCSTCHQGENLDYLVHPRNWLYDHPVAARKNMPDCSACHDRGTFCTECHIAEGIKPENHSTPSWASFIHGQVARRDPALCAGCHDAENLFICKSCHVAPGGKSPHGPDFRSNAGQGYWHDECKDQSGACFDCHRNDHEFCGRCHEKRDCE
jgi:hypothetical protein